MQWCHYLFIGVMASFQHNTLSLTQWKDLQIRNFKKYLSNSVINQYILTFDCRVYNLNWKSWLITSIINLDVLTQFSSKHIGTTHRHSIGLKLVYISWNYELYWWLTLKFTFSKYYDNYCCKLFKWTILSCWSTEHYYFQHEFESQY